MDKKKRVERANEVEKAISKSRSNIDAHYRELRRSIRSSEKLRRYEPEEKLASSVKFIKESTLRRSNRSPRKPLHFQPEYIKSTSTIKKKTRPVNKVKRDYTFPKTGSDVKSPSKLTTNRKKSQREEKDDVSQHKTKSKKKQLKKISKIKKSPFKRAKDCKKNNLSSIKQIVYPTAEEITENKRREREQIRVNRKMKAILKNLVQVPEKVQIL